jgi:hypothetical protein
VHIIYSLDDFEKLVKVSTGKAAIIGNGRFSNLYTFNKKEVATFAINNSVVNYPDPHFVVMVEDHYRMLFRYPHQQLHRILMLDRDSMKSHNLTTGCSLSLLMSFLLRHCGVKKLYIQGFSMDDDASGFYNWQRQLESAGKVLAEFKDREIVRSTWSKRFLSIPEVVPDPIDVVPRGTIQTDASAIPSDYELVQAIHQGLPHQDILALLKH